MFYSDKVRTLYCSDACRIPHSMPAGHFKIRSRDKFQCVYCGKSSIEDEIELALDHIIPRSHGGTDTAGNLVTACRDCNGQKHNTELPDDVMARLQEEVRKRNKVAGLHNDQLIRQAR